MDRKAETLSLILDDIWNALDEVADPELPIVSLVEMGIVRSIKLTSSGQATVTITPTFSGCPAQFVMREHILKKLRQNGYNDARVRVVLSPPWTSDWITHGARAKLRAFGIAPPGRVGGQPAGSAQEPIPCPHCDSSKTRKRNSFGSTPCRSIHYCDDCQQPFEAFKTL